MPREEVLINQGKQVAQDIGIDVSEQEVAENKHGTIDGGTREENQILNKQVPWVRWVPGYTRVVPLREQMQKRREREGRRKKRD